MHSKLGLHINSWSHAAQKSAEWQPAILKSIDHSADRLASYKATSPGTLTIGRVVLPGFDQRGQFNHPKRAAEKVRDLILFGIKGCRYDILEGNNEPNIGEDVEKAKSLCEFNIHLGHLIKEEGFQYAAYSFAATRPHIELAPYLGGALRHADYLAMHAYGPGPLFHESYWYLFAYRLFWNALDDFYKENLRGMLLTEYGIAKGLMWTGKDRGWKYDGAGPDIRPKHYENDLIESDKRLNRYIKGAAIYQTGDLTGKWPTFEMEELFLGLGRHICSYVRPRVNTPGIPNNDDQENESNDQENWSMEQPIRVLRQNGVVETIELEEYLKGVLPREMGPGAPMQALKAQAVAARGFVLAARVYGLYRNEGGGYHSNADVCTTTHCQVWGAEECASTNSAVEATKGVVATHDGKVILPYYFGHCDGRTRNNEDIFTRQSPKPYLRAVSCPCGYTEMYGHGVGMCQRGAMKMAENGASYQEILWHYYRGCWVDGKQKTPATSDPIQLAIKKIESAQTTQKAAHEASMRDLDDAKEGLLEWGG